MINLLNIKSVVLDWIDSFFFFLLKLSSDFDGIFLAIYIIFILNYNF